MDDNYNLLDDSKEEENDNISSEIEINENIITDNRLLNENMEIETRRNLTHFFFFSKVILISNFIFFIISISYLYNIILNPSKCENNNTDMFDFIILYCSFLVSDGFLHIAFFKFRENKIYNSIRIILLLMLFYFLINYSNLLLFNNVSLLITMDW